MAPLMKLHGLGVSAIALLLIAACGQLSSQLPGQTAQNSPEKSLKTVERYALLPLSFQPNRGQASPEVRFQAQGDNYAIRLTDDGATLVMGKPAASRRNAAASSSPDSIHMTVVRSARHAVPASNGEEPLPGRVNYFLGADSAKWMTDLPTFGKVRFSQVYDGIDLVYYGNQRQLEYDFVLAPGASPAAIRLNFSGQSQLRVGADGSLLLTSAEGTATLHRPVAYQEKNGVRQPVEARFQRLAENTVTFRLGAYDHSRQLTIDPILTYSTYLGGSGATDSYGYHLGDQGNGIAVDASGSAYVVGTTYSTDFPVTPSAYLTKSKLTAAGASTMVFISKLNPAGTALMYSTYLGGTGWYQNGDSGAGIALDAQNNAYVTGSTFSADFPVTPGAVVSPSSVAAEGYPNNFVTKLNAAGNALAYSATIGPAYGTAIAVDAAGNAYVTGYTIFRNYPTTSSAYQPDIHGQNSEEISNAVVSKLNPAGSSLAYSTYLGGSGFFTYLNGDFFEGDQGLGIAVDAAGDAYVTGVTASSDFPVTDGAFQTQYPGLHPYPFYEINIENGFVTKFNATGTGLVYSTYLGGSGSSYLVYGSNPFALDGDEGNSIAVDSSGNAYIGGTTVSSNFPVTVSGLGMVSDNTSGNSSAGFISKLNAAGSALEYSTYIGSSGASVNALAIDSAGKVYFAGNAGTNFPQIQVPVPYQNCCAYVAKMNPAAGGLEFSSYLGGKGTAGINALALDAQGSLYVTGGTAETDFPTTSGAVQPTNHAAANSASNAFISKLALASQAHDFAASAITVSASTLIPQKGNTVTFTVKVSGANGQIPSGHVLFSAAPGSTSFTGASVALDAQGSASWTYTTQALGPYTLQADYTGSSSLLQSITTLPFRVVSAPAIFPVDAYYNLIYGRPGTVLAYVEDSTEYGLPGQTVSFTSDSMTFSPASAVTASDGSVEFTVTALKAGNLTATEFVNGKALSAAVPIPFSQAYLTATVNPPLASRLYGGVNPTFTTAFVGLVGSDTLTVTYPLPSATGAVGTYTITPNLTGPDVPNYYVVTTPATLLVHPAPLVVTASSFTTRYGQPPPTPTAYTLAGFVNGETSSVVSGAPAMTTAVTASSPVGSYPISVKPGTMVAPNYLIQPNAQQGVLVVLKAFLTLAANDLTISQGSAIPPLTFTLTGFANGDTAAATITGAPKLATSATTKSKPGTYPITISAGSLTAKNYGFTPVNGTLTITP